MKSKMTPWVPRSPMMLAKRKIHACNPNVPTHEPINPSPACFDAPYSEIGKHGPWFSGVGIGASSP